MTAKRKPLTEVTRQAIEILSRELGVVDAMRFIGQFTTGQGDYTEEKDALVGQATLEQIVAEIKAMPKP